MTDGNLIELPSGTRSTRPVPPAIRARTPAAAQLTPRVPATYRMGIGGTIDSRGLSRHAPQKKITLALIFFRRAVRKPGPVEERILAKECQEPVCPDCSPALSSRLLGRNAGTAV